jgi:hypothetical protein
MPLDHGGKTNFGKSYFAKIITANISSKTALFVRAVGKN